MKMSIKVQASRFAVLRVEDDDDSDEKDTKAKQPTNKAGQQATEGKKKAKKKKKAEQLKHETEELRNLAFCKVGKKGASHSAAKGGPVSDSQWEEWQQKNEENSLQEFDKDLHDALLLSKLEFEEKQRVREAAGARQTDQGTEARNGEGKKNKKKGKGAAIHVDRLAEDGSDRQDTHKQQSSRDQLQETSSCMSGQGDRVTTLNETSKSNEKASKQNKVQEDLPKKAAVQKLSVKDYKEAVLQKEEEVKRLREVNKTIEAEVAEVKKKNQQFYLMLGRGEELSKAALSAELEEAQQTRDKLTEQVAQCSSELEKERSKSHALKAEREKLKGMKQHGGK